VFDLLFDARERSGPFNIEQVELCDPLAHSRAAQQFGHGAFRCAWNFRKFFWD
jgi:hypothetical protein